MTGPFSSCFWSGWMRIYVYIYIYYYMYLSYVSCVPYISSYIICTCICTDSRSRDIFFISFVQCSTFSTQVLLLLQLYSSCVVASGAARYIARRSWIKRWVLVLLMVQYGWKVGWFWLPSIPLRKITFESMMIFLFLPVRDLVTRLFVSPGETLSLKRGHGSSKKRPNFLDEPWTSEGVWHNNAFKVS